MSGRQPLLHRALIALITLGLGACTNMTVARVTPEKEAATKGIRYFLPKPYLQATPQADGTVSFDVIFLPDKSREYAIDLTSYGSSYTFQIARDEKGLLTAVEFKASTAAVGQQLASSAGSYAAQAYNVKAAGVVATQTQINTAQAAVDTARATYAAAQATLTSDQANGVKTDTVNADFAAVASAKAKLEIAEQALQRAQSTSQAVSTAVAATSPIATTAPTMGTPFGQPTWNPATIYSLPDRFGPVLYALNDTGSHVALVAVTAIIPGTTLSSDVERQGNVVALAQPLFKTTDNALGPPALFPSSQDVPLSAKQAVFYFDRPVKPPLPVGSLVSTDATPPVATAASPKLSSDGKTITVDISGLAAGRYVVTVKYSYAAGPATLAGTRQVKLVVTP